MGVCKDRIVRLAAGTVALVSVFAGGCTGAAPSRPNGDGGTGGLKATGGSAGAGRDGGDTETGGATGTGGVGASGGETASGGALGSGGATASGGSPAVGSGGATGGNTSAGGATGSGGAPVATNCVKALFGRYLVRTDGKLLYEEDSNATQTPILDAGSGLPLSDVTTALEGEGHGCASLGTSKAAWCWRTLSNGNNNGQLGGGSMDMSGPLYRAAPVLTAVGQPLTNVAAMADTEGRQSDTACAVTTDGKLYCWGNLIWTTNGGVPLTSAYAVPITKDGIAPLTGVLQASVGSQHACAVVQGSAAKEVWCWGRNAYGALGQGDIVTHRYPSKVVGLANPSKVLAHGAYGTTCAMEGVSVRCWGYSGYGDTGTGMRVNSVPSPTSVVLMGGAPLTDVVDIHGGENSAAAVWCGLTSQKTLQCWGSNSPNNNAFAFGLTNVIALGGTEGGIPAIRYVTSDGVYHSGTATRVPKCGSLQ